jgi:hypothetical protein
MWALRLPCAKPRNRDRDDPCRLRRIFPPLRTLQRRAGDYQPTIFHISPGQVFLSKLPEGMSDLRDYDGKGNFFKIGYAEVKDNKFVLLDQSATNFTIPATTPPGMYLMRLEHWMVN